MTQVGLKQLRQDGAAGGNVVKWNATSGEWEAGVVSGGPGLNESYLCYTDSSHPYHEFGDGSYEAGGTFIFRGTSVGTPTAIKIVGASENAGKYWDFRIYDVTNGQVICEILNNTASVPTIFDMGTLSNLPSAEAVWELQGRKNAVNGTSLQLFFAGIYY